MQCLPTADQNQPHAARQGMGEAAARPVAEAAASGVLVRQAAEGGRHAAAGTRALPVGAAPGVPNLQAAKDCMRAAARAPVGAIPGDPNRQAGKGGVRAAAGAADAVQGVQGPDRFYAKPPAAAGRGRPAERGRSGIRAPAANGANKPLVVPYGVSGALRGGLCSASAQPGRCLACLGTHARAARRPQGCQGCCSLMSFQGALGATWCVANSSGYHSDETDTLLTGLLVGGGGAEFAAAFGGIVAAMEPRQGGTRCTSRPSC